MNDKAVFLDEIKKEIGLIDKKKSLNEQIDLHLSNDYEIENERDRYEINLMKEQKVESHLNSKNNKKVLAIIPCFNEEPTIGSVVLKAKRYVDDVVVIDDGSMDNTSKVAEAAGATVISHGVNKGKSAGIKTGFQYALNNDFDYIVSLDGDGQHNADEIPNLLGNILNLEMDISLGTRYGDDTEMPLWRRIGKRILDYSTSFGNGGLVTDSQCGFRAFNKKAIEGITPRLKGDAFSVESEQLVLANKLNLSAANTHVSCKYNSLKTKTSTKKPTSHGFSVLSYVLWLVAEKRPLLYIGLPGFICVLIGIWWAILTLQYYNTTGIFLISYALITSVFLIVGALAMCMALLLNTLPHVIKKTIEEAYYVRNNRT
jgi:glycosyltransferase involved in cell wall biosynthesis